MQNLLWPFANAFYAATDVEKACLALQEQGANVCLMLCAAWLIKQHIAYSPDRAAALIELAKTHQALIEPLRALRISWRARALAEPFVAQLREQIKQLELAAERKLLEDLEAKVCTWLEQDGSTDDWFKALSTPAVLNDKELAHWHQLLEAHQP